ncbi:MogA/MoaB family molybdenum cofactor biosynthesis protein [Brachybacterium halotolerans subsp. kimchii]|uniref:MogA/MoaB family molybdenum cofactor biosynthesis protein n=1 Tax=Brachybacterium halotolerans TaxID=2795215 RepID=UPI001E2A863A|nr:MogA/MoaB family molybdenum cofactor biosynthesis protein [Brachybacterium halotolerans]UEJ83007.1 MogA/MoaB family molybdenum cofactor biosynthesis protein [Brachybacterium halotolerans subsp. kimchii]
MENPDRSATMITVSDRSAEGTREDLSGPLGTRLLEEAGWEVEGVVVPDDRDAIAGAILAAVDAGVALVVTTGGTGLGPRDVTPEATGPLLDRRIPGIAERLRAVVADRLPASMLSRGLAGLRGRTLVVNLAGSPGAVQDGMPVILSVAAHVADQVRGGDHT